jgi:hypothetical protein
VCLGKLNEHGRTDSDERMLFETVLWIACTGALGVISFSRPAIGTRYRLKASVFNRIFGAVSDDPDMDTSWSTAPSLNSTDMARAQKGGPQNQAVGRSKGFFDALVQALKIRIVKLRKQKFGANSEKIEREIEQLQLALENLEVAATVAVCVDRR